MTARRALASLAAALAATTALAVAAPVPASATDYFWVWSDGSRSADRLLAEAHYRRPTALPTLVVTAVPPGRSQRARLEVRQGGRWLPEDSAWTGERGVARLSLNPYCANGDWCDQQQQYRLTIAGESVRLTIAYASRPHATRGD